VSGSATRSVRAERHGSLRLPLDIIVPVVMSCALLWWVSLGMSWTTRLAVTVITLVVIIGIVWFERSGFF
jgi:hypothetical protein